MGEDKEEKMLPFFLWQGGLAGQENEVIEKRGRIEKKTVGAEAQWRISKKSSHVDIFLS